MKYTENHPSQDLARALHLEKSQENRINQAIMKSMGGLTEQDAVDTIIARIAPYIKTSEEAFYAAITLTGFMHEAGHPALK